MTSLHQLDRESLPDNGLCGVIGLSFYKFSESGCKNVCSTKYFYNELNMKKAHLKR